MSNKALHIDRKGRGVVDPIQSWCFRYLLQTPGSLAASELGRYSRHEVAFLYVITGRYKPKVTRRVPAGILGRRATVGLMTGCEALPTMYRNGWKPRGGYPSESSARL